MQAGKVFRSDGSGNARASDPSIASGWHYTVDMGEPIGPFPTKREAVDGMQRRAIHAPRPGDNSSTLLLAIQEQLDGVEWSSDTLERIAAIMVEGGYRIRDCNDVDREAD
jgi:hypothetical protein